MYQINENYLKLPGSYLFSTIAKKVAAFTDAHQGERVIRMGIGDVTKPLCPAVIQALHKAVDEMGEAETFRGYGPENGYAFLRDKMVEFDYKARGAEIRADEIFISDGAKSDSGNIQEIFSLDSTVAVCDPVYPVYLDTNVMAGRSGDYDAAKGVYAGITYLPCTAENDFTPAFPAGKAPDLIYLCSPNNPTGVACPASDIAAMVERVPPSVLVIIDEAYIDFATDPAVAPCTDLIGAHSNVLVMRTFSKAHALAGLRIGYGLGDAGLIDAVQALLVPFGVSGPAQAAALASLRDGAPAREAVRAVTRERDRVVPLLRGMGYDVPDSQANFYFLKGEGAGFVEACAAAGLVVRPFPEGVRVTVGTPEQNDALLAAAGVYRT